MGFFIRVLINVLAIYFAAAIVPGIELSGVMAALGSGLVLGLVNAVVRPILIIMTLPFTLLTLGLFLFVLNGLCLCQRTPGCTPPFRKDESDIGHCGCATASYHRD